MKRPSVSAACRRVDTLIKLWRDKDAHPTELVNVAAQLDAPSSGSRKEWMRFVRKVLVLAAQLSDWQQFQARLEQTAERHSILGVTQLVTALCCCTALCMDALQVMAEALDPEHIWAVVQLLSSLVGPCATTVQRLSSDPVGEAWCRETVHKMTSAARVALQLAAAHCGAALSAYVADNMQQLMCFLELVCSTLLAEGTLKDGDDDATVLYHCTGLVYQLLARPEVCAAVAASTSSGGTLQQTLVQLMLRRFLPFAAALICEPQDGMAPRPGACSCAECSSRRAAAAASGEMAASDWQQACNALHLVTGPVLHEGLQQHLRSSSGIAGGQERLRLVQQAADMVRLMPQECPAVMDAAYLPTLHSDTIQLLGTLCSCLPLPRRPRQEAAGQPGLTAPPTLAQQAALAAIVAVPAMCLSLRKALSKGPVEGASDAGDTPADPATDDAGMPAGAPGLERMCQAASSVLAVAPSLATAVLSAEQTRLLLAAGTASLRLLPQLQQLQQAGRSDGNAVAARLLAARCLAAAHAAAEAAEAAVAQAGVDAAMNVTDANGLARVQAVRVAAWQALLPELQQLSVAACRAVHWHAAVGGADLLPASLWVRMPQLLQDLSPPVLTADQPGDRHTEGLEAGHAAALLALAPAFAAGAPAAAAAESGRMQCSANEQYGIALADAYSRSPLALRPALLEELASVIAERREQGGGKLILAFAERLLAPAARCPPLAAELVWRGLLPVLLEPVPTGRALMMYGPDGGVQQVTVLAMGVAMAAGKMYQALVAEARQLAAAGVLAGDEEATCTAVRAVERLVGPALRHDTPEQLSQFKHIAAQSALAQLGAAVAAAHRQRAEDAAGDDALALARAAATRPCAYLRCANLAGGGGAWAGEGEGSMKCSACRAAWYCGTACSHANWREGGHRRACKRLAAERAARKAAQQQA